VGSLVVALVLTSSVARADAIVPFEGACPPGLRLGESGHAEVCQPMACTTDADCGERAACRPIAECWAPREVSPSDGRVANDMVMRDVVIGLCAADGTCREGQCSTRRQCEPVASTEAWDPAGHRWTGQPYHAGCAATLSPRSAPSGTWTFGLATLGLALARGVRRRSRVVGRAEMGRPVSES
jgi:hypothetical protein